MQNVKKEDFCPSTPTPQKPPNLDLALLLYQPLISHFKIDFLSEAAGFRAKKVPFFVGGVKSA